MTHTTELQQTALAGVQGEYGIIKTDRLGRLRISKEHRESLLDAFEQSSMSRRQFAEYCGVKYTTFTEWMTRRLRERREQSGQVTPSPGGLALAEVELAPATGSDDTLSVELPGGARIRLTGKAQAGLAAELINHLSR